MSYILNAGLRFARAQVPAKPLKREPMKTLIESLAVLFLVAGCMVILRMRRLKRIERKLLREAAQRHKVAQWERVVARRKVQ
jgi:hypothetical protein